MRERERAREKKKGKWSSTPAPDSLCACVTPDNTFKHRRGILNVQKKKKTKLKTKQLLMK